MADYLWKFVEMKIKHGFMTKEGAEKYARVNYYEDYKIKETCHGTFKLIIKDKK